MQNYTEWLLVCEFYKNCSVAWYVAEYYATSTLKIPQIPIVLLLLIFLSVTTILDLLNPTAEGCGYKFTRAFAVHRNLKTIFNTKSNPNSIHCLHSLRFLMIFWIATMHSFFTLETFVTRPLEMRHEMNHSPLWYPIASGATGVQGFFLIGGCVHVYSVLGKLTKNPKLVNSGKFWIEFFVHRMARIWPVLFAVYLVAVSGFSWTFCHDSFFNSGWGTCRNWVEIYKTLFFLNSPILLPSCIGWTWYISADMIFYCLSPFFLIYMLKIRGWSYVIGGMWLAFVAKLILTSGCPAEISESGGLMDLIDPCYWTYFTPVSRFISYGIGMLTGYFIRAQVTFKPFIYRLLVLYAIIGILFSIFGFYPWYANWVTGIGREIYRRFLSLTNDFIFSSALACLIVACHANFACGLGWVLNWRGFIPLGNLTYCFYMTHIMFQGEMWSYLDLPLIWPISAGTLVWVYVVQLVGAYLIAICLSLVVEHPFMNLEKYLFKRRARNTRVGDVGPENELQNNDATRL